MLEEFFKDLSEKIAYIGAATVCVKSVVSIYTYKLIERNRKNVPLKLVDTPLDKQNRVPHELQLDNIDESLRERVLNFQSTFESIPHIKKDSFYKNMKSVRVKVYSKSLLRRITTISRGAYEPIKNKLTLMCDRKSTFFHELFHLSSSVAIDQNRYITGFQTTHLDDNYDKGRGLNEGYTELLRDRYFKEENVSYIDLVLICVLLELIAGREVMEELYFENNLKSLGEAINEFLEINVDDPKEDPFAILVSQIDFYFAISYGTPFISPLLTIKDYKNIIFNILVLLARAAEKSIYVGNIEDAEKFLNAIHEATPLLTKKKKKELKMLLMKIQDDIKDFSTIEDISKCVEGTPKIRTIKSVKNSLQNRG